MAFDLYTLFLVLFVLLLMGLGVSNFVEAKNEQDQTLGRQYFGFVFLVFAVGLIVFKIKDR